MTVRITLSLPDDVAKFLQTFSNQSAVAAQAVRAFRDDAERRRAARRASAEAIAAWLADGADGQAEALDTLAVSSLDDMPAWNE